MKTYKEFRDDFIKNSSKNEVTTWDVYIKKVPTYMAEQIDENLKKEYNDYIEMHKKDELEKYRKLWT